MAGPQEIGQSLNRHATPREARGTVYDVLIEIALAKDIICSGQSCCYQPKPEYAVNQAVQDSIAPES